MTFANPWAFLLLPAIIPLILLYLFKEVERKMAVPSLLFWKSLENRPSASKSTRMQRFITEPLFWLQLLVLLFIIGTLAEPLIQKSVRKVVLILDISASMQTREAGGNRLTLAKAEAHRIINNLEETDQVAIITSAVQPERVLDFTVNKDLARNKIAGIEAEDTPTRLHEALTLATTMADADKVLDVIIISDQPEERPGRLPDQTSINLHAITVGQTDVNVGFVAFHPGSAVFGPGVAGDLILRNYQSKPSLGRLHMIQDNQSILNEPMELPPGGSVPIIIEDLDSPAPVEIIFETNDSLALDNRAYFLPVSNQNKTLQVFTDTPALVLLLNQLEDFQVSVLPLSGHADADQSHDVYIYDGVVPDSYPDGGVIVFAPTDPGQPLTDIEIYDWSPDHPILRDVVLERISLSGAALITQPPPWATVIAQTQEHPLILAGDPASSRRVIFAPDLIRQIESPTALLLFLKTLAWVNPGTRSDRRQLKTGDPFVQRAISDTGKITILSPSGIPLPIMYQNESLHMSHTNKSGIYTVQSELGDRYFAANLFNEIESDIRPPRGRQNEGLNVDLNSQAVIDTAYWRWTLWAAMGGVLICWFYQARRQRP
jgi:hypothetical protein